MASVSVSTTRWGNTVGLVPLCTMTARGGQRTGRRDWQTSAKNASAMATRRAATLIWACGWHQAVAVAGCVTTVGTTHRGIAANCASPASSGTSTCRHLPWTPACPVRATGWAPPVCPCSHTHPVMPTRASACVSLEWPGPAATSACWDTGVSGNMAADHVTAREAVTLTPATVSAALQILAGTVGLPAWPFPLDSMEGVPPGTGRMSKVSPLCDIQGSASAEAKS